MVKPKLEDYDIKVLVVLGNQTTDIVTYNRIKFIILERINNLNYSMFFLVNKFINSEKIMKEVYAELITMAMVSGKEYLNELIMDEVVKLVSIDTLMCYGMESISQEFSDKCKKEFWNRSLDIENKTELRKKKNIDNPISRKIIIGSKKGD